MKDIPANIHPLFFPEAVPRPRMRISSAQIIFSLVLLSFFYFNFGFAQVSAPPETPDIVTDPDRPDTMTDEGSGEHAPLASDSTEGTREEKAGAEADKPTDETLPFDPLRLDKTLREPPQEKILQSTQKIRVIHLTGATLLTADQIAEVTRTFIGQEVNLAVLANLSEAITQAYYKKGFFLVKTYLPEQEIQQGLVVISVLEGKISDLAITGNEYYPTAFIQKHFVAIHEPRGANLNSINRSISILDDYPDLKANVFIKPGELPGTANMEVQILDYQPAHLTLDYNNFGAPSVSRDRLGIELDLGNLFSDGHRFTARATTGLSGKMTFLRAGYEAPWGYAGHRIHASYARGDFDVGRELAQLDIRMQTEALALSVSYPFFKTASSGLMGEIGFEGNDFTQTTLGILSNKDKIRVLKGGGDYNRAKENTRDFVSFHLTQGLGQFLDGNPRGSPFSSRADADNQFTKATVEAVRIRTIPEPYWLFHPFSVILRSGLQVSSDNLVAGEQFVLGGPDSVRGYANGEFLGDHGYRVSSELRFFPVAREKRLQGAVFLDHGGSFVKHRQEDHYLTGIGWGLRFDFPKAFTLREPGPTTRGYILESRFQIRADVGYPLDPRPSASGKNPVYLIYAVGRF